MEQDHQILRIRFIITEINRISIQMFQNLICQQGSWQWIKYCMKMITQTEVKVQ